MKNEKKHLISIISLLLFCVFALGSSDTETNTNSNTNSNTNISWETKNNRSMAYIMMEDFIKSQLKSPSTAKFPGVFAGKLDHVSAIGNQTYIIRSYVDSQNGFGAIIRTNFIGKIKQIGANNWKLLSLEF